MSTEKYITYEDSEGWQGLVLADWHDFTGGHSGLEAWLSSQTGRRIVTHPSRTVDLLSTARGRIYAKHFLSASDKDSLFNRLKWYFRPSRSLYILRIGEELTDAGFAVPQTLLSVRRRSRWGWPEDFHLSLDCGEQTLNLRLRALRESGVPDDSPAVRDLLRELAVRLVDFHRCGFVHGDCQPCNVSLTSRGSLLLLDNDRTTGGHGGDFCRAKRRNLEQCARYLTLGYPSTDNTRFFLDCYAEADGWPEEQRSSRLPLIEKHIKHKMEAC